MGMVRLKRPQQWKMFLEELKGLGANVASDIDEPLLEGRIQIYATIDERIQRLAMLHWKSGLNFMKGPSQEYGLIQGWCCSAEHDPPSWPRQAATQI